MTTLKESTRIARHKRIRKRVKSKSGCPRLCIHRSLKNMYIQVIDDSQTKTVLSYSTLNKDVRNKYTYGGNVTAAGLLGELTAQRLQKQGINKVVFDRGGYQYHGRVKALAEGLRKGGIKL